MYCKASLNGGFMEVSCTLIRPPHQQFGCFCMKRRGERRRSFHPYDTTSSNTVKLNEICTEALVAFHGGVVRVDRVGTT